MHSIRIERPEDVRGIRQANGRASDTAAEMDLVDALPQPVRTLVSMVAIDNDAMVGHILSRSTQAPPLRGHM